VDLEINKDRNVEFRVLVIDAETPMPDQNAGSYAAIQEMRMLQALGFKCTFVPQNMAYMGRYTENLQRMGIECVYAPFASNLDGVIESRGREFDLVYITRYYVAQQCVAKIRQHAPQAKIVLMNADLHFLRELREALNSGKSDDIARAVVTRDEELQVMRSVDLVLSYTDVEKAVILSHNLESSNVARCPWVCETVDEVAPFEERRDVAFLGGYNHAPNVDAVQWFAQKVMPLLRETLPGVRFRVYGSNVPPELVEFAAQYDDVVIDGWVADVAEVYDTCRVFIAPLQSGAGIKGKVIGALAHGVPCVLSQVAAEGIPVGDGLDAAIGGTPEEWAAWITRIYQDSGAWATMSEHARQFARRRYGMEKGVEDMRVALQQAEFFTSTDNRTLAYR
jgi:glycosyltransferase involved in cell wall biosynthesis